MAHINAWTNGEYLGSIQTHQAHSIAPGDIVTVQNLVCGDTCKARILHAPHYTDRFFTSTFRIPQWNVQVDVQEPWKRPAPPEHLQNCNEPCLTTSSSTKPALRLVSCSDIV